MNRIYNNNNRKRIIKSKYNEHRQSNIYTESKNFLMTIVFFIVTEELN